MLTSTKKVYEEILELLISERVELFDKLLLDLTPTNNYRSSLAGKFFF